MPVYVVTWNLNNEKSNYNAKRDKLFEVFAEFNRYRQTNLDSVIFLESHLPPLDLTNKILLALDSNDTLFVSRLRSGEFNGWLEQEAFNWINQRI